MNTDTPAEGARDRAGPGGTADGISIGQAAEQVDLATSALRYYDQRRIVTPHRDRHARRRYTPTELRRLAFVKIATELGIPLETARAVLDEPDPRWRAAVQTQIDELDRLIAKAQGTRHFLTYALRCPASHPARDCPEMTTALDRVLAGASVAALADDHPPPPSEPPRV